MRINDPVRFVTKSRFDDYQKGDDGFIYRVLSEFPEATASIYFVQVQDGPLVWCTSEDIMPWNQLKLF
jgi:hypothetical protein